MLKSERSGGPCEGGGGKSRGSATELLDQWLFLDWNPLDDVNGVQVLSIRRYPASEAIETSAARAAAIDQTLPRPTTADERSRKQPLTAGVYKRMRAPRAVWRMRLRKFESRVADALMFSA